MARAPREARPKRPEDTTLLEFWRPEQWEKAEASAIQAIVRGNPNADQCARFIKWLTKVTMLYDQTYSPLSDRDSNFAEGRRFIGRRFVILSKTNLSKIREDRAHDLENE